jgi:hypothetical protein
MIILFDPGRSSFNCKKVAEKSHLWATLLKKAIASALSEAYVQGVSMWKELAHALAPIFQKKRRILKQ